MQKSGHAETGEKKNHSLQFTVIFKDLSIHSKYQSLELCYHRISIFFVTTFQLTLKA